MNALQMNLDRLVSFFPDWSKQPPSWSRILVAEATNMQHGNVIQVPRSALATPEEYATRFDRHINAGYAWINMNAFGVWNEALLIVIELPDHTNTVPPDRTSVNFSGPHYSIDGETQWDLVKHIKIVG